MNNFEFKAFGHSPDVPYSYSRNPRPKRKDRHHPVCSCAPFQDLKAHENWPASNKQWQFFRQPAKGICYDYGTFGSRAVVPIQEDRPP